MVRTVTQNLIGATMKLYYSPNLNPRVAVAVARHLQSPVRYVAASPMHPDQQEAFRAINPNTRVPVLVTETRTYWEADAIACTLSALAGSVDVDAIALSLAGNAGDPARHADAVRAILIAALSNTVVKCAMVVGLGSGPRCSTRRT